MKTIDCKDFQACLAAWCDGDLSTDDKSTCARHLADCAVCQGEAEEMKRVLARLRELPQVSSSRDLVPEVMASIAKVDGRILRMRWTGAAAAAILLGISMLPLLPNRGSDQVVTNGRSVAQLDSVVSSQAATDESLTRAVDWFLQSQEPDGSWNAARWGGSERFEGALTGLPLLVLSQVESTPATTRAAKRAIDYLIARQNAQGVIGSGASIDHSIAVLALLRASQQWPEFVPARSLHAAVIVLAREQTAAEMQGWRGPEEVNAQWRNFALGTASQLGWDVARWALPSDGTPSLRLHKPENIDIHQSFFVVQALQAQNTSGARERLAQLREELRKKQTETGGDILGSWPPEGPWASVGGRVSATALASLALAE